MVAFPLDVGFPFASSWDINVIRIGRRVRDLCHLGDLVDALFKAQFLSHRKNGHKGDRVWGDRGYYVGTWVAQVPAAVPFERRPWRERC